MQDEQLIFKKMQQGDTNALSYFFKEYMDTLFYQALGFVKDKSAAEDLVQEVFIRFWDKKEHIQITNSIGKYLYQSTINACKNYLKEQTSRLANERFFQEELENEEEFDEERLIRLQEQLQKLILQLPRKCQEIFRLACIEGLSYKEVSAQLHVSENTVKTQIKIAYSRLRQDLKLKEFLFLLTLLANH